MLLLVMLIFILVLGIFFRLYFDQLFYHFSFVSCYGSRGPFCRLFLRCKVDEGFSDKYEVWGLKFLKLVPFYARKLRPCIGVRSGLGKLSSVLSSTSSISVCLVVGKEGGGEASVVGQVGVPVLGVQQPLGVCGVY